MLSHASFYLALSTSQAVYPDPHEFKPERFLLDGKLNPAVKDPITAFGFGRRYAYRALPASKFSSCSRLCPGRHMATSTIWIAVVSILAAFDIRKAVDEDGRDIEPTYEFLSGSIR